jgi:hypothetical protein
MSDHCLKDERSQTAQSSFAKIAIDELTHVGRRLTVIYEHGVQEIEKAIEILEPSEHAELADWIVQRPMDK